MLDMSGLSAFRGTQRKKVSTASVLKTLRHYAENPRVPKKYRVSFERAVEIVDDYRRLEDSIKRDIRLRMDPDSPCNVADRNYREAVENGWQ